MPAFAFLLPLCPSALFCLIKGIYISKGSARGCLSYAFPLGYAVPALDLPHAPALRTCLTHLPVTCLTLSSPFCTQAFVWAPEL
eukprot:1158180-Pelagomonas_calceolata.AAC.3